MEPNIFDKVHEVDLKKTTVSYTHLYKIKNLLRIFGGTSMEFPDNRF